MGNFFWSYCKKIPAGLGYGALYNWFCTQPKVSSFNYGYLYNWYSASNANFAPSGWHVPTIAENDTLRTTLGGWTIAGDKMKEIGTTYWTSPNTGADNSSGFNGRGCGYRVENGTFTGGKGISYMAHSNTSYYSRLQSVTHAFDAVNNPQPKAGYSVRLIKDDSTDPGTLTDFDGNVYPTVDIGGQIWTASNWMCKHLNDGTAIPEVTDNATWAGLTTGARCSYGNEESNAATYTSIAPVGWHVPTSAEVTTLRTYLGGYSIAGGKLKETGTIHWTTPNTGADNSSGFNGVGGGFRHPLAGYFQSLGLTAIYRTSTNAETMVQLDYESSNMGIISATGIAARYGASIRLIKNDSTNPGTLTDIDGNVYNCVTIGTQVWTASNFKCTKLNDGTPIANVTDNAAWSLLSTMGMCYYNNDILNA